MGLEGIDLKQIHSVAGELVAANSIIFPCQEGKVGAAFDPQAFWIEAYFLVFVELNEAHKLFVRLHSQDVGFSLASFVDILNNDFLISQIVSKERKIANLLKKLVRFSGDHHVLTRDGPCELRGKSCLQQGILVTFLDRDVLANVYIVLIS